MSHLAARVTTLVDGQLSIEAAERAHVHLAGCRDCRDVVEAERLIKGRLSVLADPQPGVDLMNRLLAMGGPSGPLPPRVGHVPGSPRPVPPRWQPAVTTSVDHVPVLTSSRLIRTVASVRPAGRGSARSDRPPARPVARDRVRRRRVLAGAVLGALGVVGAGVGGLSLPPSPPQPNGRLNPSFDSVMVNRWPSTTTLLFPVQQESGLQIESVLATSRTMHGRN